MKLFFRPLALASAVLVSSISFAQMPALEKTAARGERHVQGSKAARTFVPGEGDPKPAGRAKVEGAARIAAREARKPEKIEASHSFKPGEGDPRPQANVTLSSSERKAGREANRREVARLNKAGDLPSYRDNYGGK